MPNLMHSGEGEHCRAAAAGSCRCWDLSVQGITGMLTSGWSRASLKAFRAT